MININGKPWEKLKLTDIKDYLNNADSDETFFIEFKEENIRKEQIAKAISAFANTYGGYFILGVDDDKNIIGCTKWSELQINSIIYGNISPTPQFDIKKFKLGNNKEIFIIKVEEGTEPPYITGGGKIFQRISSSSQPVNDAFSINRLYEKKLNSQKNIENKLYYEPLSGNIINNLCGYVDFGFSILPKDIDKIHDKIDNIDYCELVKLIKENTNAYSISKVGYSLCISIGENYVSQGDTKILTPAEVNNFMEILGDGSFRCRIIFASNNDGNVSDISPILLINGLFRNIYEFIFGKDISSNFIESLKYEKLTVLKQFYPKYVLYDNDSTKQKFESFYENQREKYGKNIIMSSNRIPLNGFIKMDKKVMTDHNYKFTSENIYNHLFYTCYYNLGYIDHVNVTDDDL